jgi:superfamily II DNA/RNA helicase
MLLLQSQHVHSVMITHNVPKTASMHLRTPFFDSVEAVHSGIDEADRAEVLSRFSQGTLRVIVCTDVLARGVDTLAAEHIIQAEFASDAVSYVHRVGRTGRAGRGGRVTNLVTRSGLHLAEQLAEAAEKGTPVDAAFSRNRSLRRTIKKRAVQGALAAVLSNSSSGEQLPAAESARTDAQTMSAL